MFELDGRTALVTGAGQNVGAGIARALAEQGATVVVNDLHPERAGSVVEEINAAGGHAVAAPFDVTSLIGVRDGLARAIEKTCAPVDILIHNAGTTRELPGAHGFFRDLDPGDWRGAIDLNLYGLLNTTRAVIDQMCERRWGRIIQISSGSARTGQAIGVSMYAAGKSGGEGFIRHLAAEVAGDGVTANSLALGRQETLAHGLEPDAAAALHASIPVGRLGVPADAAALCVYLASAEAAWMTGQTIDLNGGTQTR